MSNVDPLETLYNVSPLTKVVLVVPLFKYETHIVKVSSSVICNTSRLVADTILAYTPSLVPITVPTILLMVSVPDKSVVKATYDRSVSSTISPGINAFPLLKSDVYLT